MVHSQLLRSRDISATDPVAPIVVGLPDLPHPRFPFLDGMRALAALAVVVLHAFQIFGLGLDQQLGPEVGRGGLTSGGLDRVILVVYDTLVRRGALAVPVFIVISGYSLMLPVARSREGRLAGGAPAFFRRRVRRILPPYYAALALSLLLIAAVPGMNTKANLYWDFALPALEPRVIVAHLLFIHNGEGYWGSFHGINPPMWSIGVEEQIYLLFPLLVLLWRAWGGKAMLAAALVYGILPIYLPFHLLPLSHFWYVGLFALGMLAASIGVSAQAGYAGWRERLPWGKLAVLALPVLGGWLLLQPLAPSGPISEVLMSRWLEDYFLGFAVICLLIFCTKLSTNPTARRPLVLRTLETPGLVHIGKFSYSVYLLHAPILALVALICRSLGLPVTLAHLIVITVGVPLVVLGAYLFFLAFERPFLSSHAALRRS